jgi:hypothetical protein
VGVSLSFAEARSVSMPCFYLAHFAEKMLECAGKKTFGSL